LTIASGSEHPTREPPPIARHKPIPSFDDPNKGNSGEYGSRFLPAYEAQNIETGTSTGEPYAARGNDLHGPLAFHGQSVRHWWPGRLLVRDCTEPVVSVLLLDPSDRAAAEPAVPIPEEPHLIRPEFVHSPIISQREEVVHGPTRTRMVLPPLLLHWCPSLGERRLSLSSTVSGKPQEKYAALSWCRFDAGGPAKKIGDNITGNREPQPRSLSQRLGGEELVKNLLDIFRRNTTAVIAYPDLEKVFALIDLDMDLSTVFVCVVIGVNGILKQIGQNLAELAWVTVQDGVRGSAGDDQRAVGEAQAVREE
jgi:hypothetical protein